MPIKVYSDRIELGDKIITATPTGIRIDDSLLANTQNVRVGNTNFTARELASGNFVFQGSIAGFTSGGYTGAVTNTIDKFSFASATTNATDVGDLTVARYSASGQSSSLFGYSSGGNIPPGFVTHTNTIDKFPFATNGNATDVGDLSQIRGLASGQSSSVNGYMSGGRTPTPSFESRIDKFPFATDTNASNIGNLTVARQTSSGQSSTTHGYVSGGDAPPGVNTIDKFPFSADTNATDVGDLSSTRSSTTGQSSTTFGYVAGGSPTTNTIEKFSFATDGNTTDVGDLTQARYGSAGQSSTTYGYISGGDPAVAPTVNTIDRFPFASDTNASDVGDLTLARSYCAGIQV